MSRRRRPPPPGRSPRHRPPAPRWSLTAGYNALGLTLAATGLLPMNPGPSLRLLRLGDHRATLMEATGNEPSVATAPVVVAMTSTFWRNAWRYRERAYRHTYWDAGVSLSHILAVAASGHVATKLLFGYADPLVNALLGVDGVRESTVALVALGDAGAGPPSPPASERLDLPTKRLSSAEVTWHAITDMHLASSLSTSAEAAQWRSRDGVGRRNVARRSVDDELS